MGEFLVFSLLIDLTGAFEVWMVGCLIAFVLKERMDDLRGTIEFPRSLSGVLTPGPSDQVDLELGA